jgi:polyferredoxin
MARISQRQKIRSIFAVAMVLLFPLVYYYFSPYLVIMGAAEGIITGSLIVFAAMFATSLFFGRAFCGWLCPAGAMQELCAHVNGKSYNGRKRNILKYVVWVPWITIIAVMFIPAGGVKAVDPLYQTYYGISIQDLQSVVMFAAIAGAIAVFALAAGKRAACHSICWMAPFMIIGTKIKNAVGYPSLHLKADKSRCIQCRQCSRNCPMSLDVTAMVQSGKMVDVECILCGSCVDTCPEKAIEYSFSDNKPTKPANAQ